MHASSHHSWETVAQYRSPHFSDEKLRCRVSPGRAGKGGPRWSMFICDIFPTFSCCATLPRPVSGSVGWLVPLWTSFAWCLISWNLEEGKWDFQWEIIPCARVREQPATHALQEQFLFRSTFGMRRWEPVSCTPRRIPPKIHSVGCFLLSAMAQPLSLCEYNRALATSSACGEKEPFSLPYAPAFCHSCFSVCSGEEPVLTHPRFDKFVSSPPPISYSLGRVSWI